MPVTSLALIAALVAGQVAGPGEQVIPDPTLLRWDQTAWTHAVLEEPPGTVAHVLWNGSALVDLKGNSWTQNGTVPQVAAPGPFLVARAGAGPFDLTKYYSLGTGNDPLDFTGDFVLHVVYDYSVAGGKQLVNGVSNTEGWWADYGRIVTSSAGADCDSGGATPLARAANLSTYWRVGLKIYAKTNGATTSSNTCAAITAGTNTVMKLGYYPGFGAGKMWEFMAAAATVDESYVAQVHARYLGHSVIRPSGTAWTVARNAAENYIASDGKLYPAPVNTLAQTATGAQVYGASANRVTNSEAIGSWTAQGTPAVVADQYDLLGLGQTMEKVTIDAVGEAMRQVQSGGAASTAWLHSCWTRADTGTSTESVIAYCSAVSACTCGRSDGGACTAEIILGTDCSAYATVGTTPVRLWAAATCTSTDLAQGRLSPGRYNTDVAAVGGFGGCQLEPGVTVPGPYHATTSAPVTWPGTTPTLTRPPRALDREGCVATKFLNPGIGASTRIMGFGESGDAGLALGGATIVWLWDGSGSSSGTMSGTGSIARVGGWWAPGVKQVVNLDTGVGGTLPTYDGTMYGPGPVTLGTAGGAAYPLSSTISYFELGASSRGCRRVP